MKKNILYICEAMGGGVRKHVLDILLKLDMNRYQASFIYNDQRGCEIFSDHIETLRSKGIKLYKVDEMVRALSPRNDAAALLKVIKIIKEVRPDIVHCHSSKAGGIGRLAARWCGITNVIYTPHAYVFQDEGLGRLKKLLYLVIERTLGRMTSVTVNVSEGERHFAIQNKLAAKHNSVLIYNGIAAPDSRIYRPKDKVIIGTSARFDDQKDPWTFYQIAKEIVRKYDHVEFVYIGDGIYKDEIEEAIRKEKLEHKITLVGFKKDVMEWVRTFDVYLTTSLYEGLPYSLVEALSLGMPIVATDVTGNNEVVVDHYNGLLFEAKNIAQGVDKLEQLLDNPDLVRLYGERSALLFRQYFTLEHMMHSLELTYHGNQPDNTPVTASSAKGLFYISSEKRKSG